MKGNYKRIKRKSIISLEMLREVQSKQKKNDPYDIEREGWYDEFERLEDSLTKCLLLVAIMTRFELIDAKESTQYKTYIMKSADQQRFEIVENFESMGNLYVLRGMLRGHLNRPYVKIAGDCISPITPQPVMKETLWECDSPLHSLKLILTKHSVPELNLDVLS